MKSGDGNRQSKSLIDKYKTGKKISKVLTKQNTHPFRKDEKKK